jgi:replicative DNA helicase
MTPELTRLPPYNLEAEQAVLGSMLLDRDAIALVLEVLHPGDFYREPHTLIFTAIMELFERGEPVDIVTVVDALRDKGKLEMVGGTSYIASLAESVPTSTSAVYYSRIVEEKSVLRHLIVAGTKIAGLGYETDTPLETLVDQAEKEIYAIAQRRLSGEFVWIRDLLKDAYDRIDRMYHRKRFHTGVPSGFEDLDRLTTGFQPADLIIVAARPSIGKTSLCLNIAENAGLKEKVPVAIFSLEMSKEQLVQRMISSLARVDAQALRTGFLDEKEDFEKISRALAPLYEAPIFVDDTPGISVMEIRVKARRLKMERGLGLIIVDYLQLMTSRTRAENRVQEISEITRSLKALARELSVPLIAVSQLSREVEKTERRPQLSDLRESGSIEQDADVVLLLSREKTAIDKPMNQPVTTEIHLAKHRNGPTKRIEVQFMRKYTRFESMEHTHTEEF